MSFFQRSHEITGSLYCQIWKFQAPKNHRFGHLLLLYSYIYNIYAICIDILWMNISCKSWIIHWNYPFFFSSDLVPNDLTAPFPGGASNPPPRQHWDAYGRGILQEIVVSMGASMSLTATQVINSVIYILYILACRSSTFLRGLFRAYVCLPFSALLLP